MFTSPRLLVSASLCVIGLGGWTTRGQEPQDHTGPGASGQVVTEAAAQARPPRQPSFVLLTDSRLVSGVVTEEDAMIAVTQPIGAMRFPKKRIEKVFSSLREVYQYKLEQLPENDFDERIKLARWCLEYKMEPEARGQLEAILARNPKHQQARAMLVSLDQAESRKTERMRDPEVRQTGGEQTPAASEGRPNSLDASVITGARRGMGVSDLPVIFDLPPAQAVKRSDEFARYVHPVLQTYCARCHNDQYDGSFQLVPFKTKLDRTREALGANLDATLKLVDRENPTRSDLLSSTLRPHGRGPNMRPIFQGSNDRAYKILANWVFKLQAAKAPDGVTPARLGAPDLGAGEAFASERGRSLPQVESNVAATQRFNTGPVETKVVPPVRFDPARGMVPDTKADPDEFPLPLAAGGTPSRKSKIPPPVDAAAALKNAASGKAQKAPSGSSPRKPTVDQDEEVEAGSGPDSAAATATKPKKPALKLDPALLQKALQLKNQNR
jgi:hypothetical protein